MMPTIEWEYYDSGSFDDYMKNEDRVYIMKRVSEYKMLVLRFRVTESISLLDYFKRKLRMDFTPPEVELVATGIDDGRHGASVDFLYHKDKGIGEELDGWTEDKQEVYDMITREFRLASDGFPYESICDID
jgi:hypothetical protein